MRVICPKCGFSEPPVWKNRYWQLYQQYTRIEELESFKDTQDLAAVLRKCEPVKKGFKIVSYSDGYYNYQIRVDGFVIRIPIKCAESPDIMREPQKEKSRTFDPMQRRLEET